VLKRNAKVRLVRDSVQVWEGSLASLRRVKDDVREVPNGFECGVGLENYNDVHEKDVIECFELEQISATL
jgi:translation initiation factor IF-2